MKRREPTADEVDAAAATIQAGIRGFLTRKHIQDGLLEMEGIVNILDDLS